MVRIIYNWFVETENLENFKESWRYTTNKIHNSVSGAKGSFMLQKKSNPNEILTIAKWEKLSDWENFWGTETPTDMYKMHKLGTRLSHEVYDEIEDYTK